MINHHIILIMLIVLAISNPRQLKSPLLDTLIHLKERIVSVRNKINPNLNSLKIMALKNLLSILPNLIPRKIINLKLFLTILTNRKLKITKRQSTVITMVLYSWILNQRSLKILWTASHHHTVSISTLLVSKNKNTVEVVTTINPCQERKKITYQNKKITEKVQLKVKESDQHQSILISVWLEKIISK